MGKRTFTTSSGIVLICAARLLCAQDTEDETATEYEQGFGLVYQQASKLTNIDKLLIVKGESDAIEEVTDALAEVSASVGSKLETFAASRESIVLEKEFLPAVEAGARTRMGMDIAGELLFSFGCNFEQSLLFTEAVASLRMHALSREMEDRAPDDEQRELWGGIASEIEPVFERIRGLLQSCGDAE